MAFSVASLVSAVTRMIDFDPPLILVSGRFVSVLTYGIGRSRRVKEKNEHAHLVSFFRTRTCISRGQALSPRRRAVASCVMTVGRRLATLFGFATLALAASLATAQSTWVGGNGLSWMTA